MGKLTAMLLVGGYAWISWQDFKKREVYLISYLPVFILMAVRYGYLRHPDSSFILVNLYITGIIISMLFLIYLVRYGAAFFKKIRASVGSGDLLLLPVIIVSFSPVSFVLFLVISLTTGLSYWLAGRMLHSRQTTIPLAGITTLLLALILIFQETGWFDPLQNIVIQ